MIKYESLMAELEARITSLYNDKSSFEKIKKVLDKWNDVKFDQINKVDEKTVYMITYGDGIVEKDVKTLKTLHKFCNEYLKGVISDIHLLPMFEYTSDDGFSVVDYRMVDKNLGDFDDIEALTKDYRLMFDFVANHVSKSSHYFKEYLKDNPEYKDFFVEFEEDFDYSQITRPRTSPLFHEYENNHKVLTTFSEDQVDVNVKNPAVLAELIDVLLFYAFKGASSIRLDAIGFLWKKSKTTSIHLPETHEIVKLWRLIMDYYKPNTQLITETNVPHIENISYFGNEDEANMVYQFALPPLTLHTFVNEDSTILKEWANSINLNSDKTTYFNFLSSHDGIGLRPTEGILSDEQRAVLVNRVIKNGGKVSYKSNVDGSKSVYEMNINYHDAIVNNEFNEETQIKQIIAANAILFTIIGVPTIYYHSLLGSRNDYEGLENSQINRRINREKLDYQNLKDNLSGDTRRNKIFTGIKNLISEKQKYTALNPYAEQKVLETSKYVFGIERYNKETNQKIQVFVNISNQPQIVDNYDVKLEAFEYKIIEL